MVNRRERLGPMPTSMGSASGIGTLHQKDRSGLQETFIFPVMGVVLVDIVQAILYYATIVASLYLLYRLTRRLVQGSIHPRLVREPLWQAPLFSSRVSRIRCACALAPCRLARARGRSETW